MINKEINLAWQLVQNTGCNVFLTGKAGTGKTTFLRDFCSRTDKRTVVLAPTGIAAINAHGSTLHSFFQLPFGPYIPGTTPTARDRGFKFSERKRRLIRSLDLVVIDEVSMVRADLLDSIDAVLRSFRDRTRPFGGVQLLLIGDLQQLAPVAKPEEWATLQPYYDTQYFFSSLALKEAGYITVELQTVYRQSDEKFVDLLNRVRNNQADVDVLKQLNARYHPNFKPAVGDGYIRLVTHNRQADTINQHEMDALGSQEHTYIAEVRDEFPALSFPTAQELTLKVGAQVMFVKNDSSIEKRYFNGMLGTVVSMTENAVNVLPHDGGTMIFVTPELWENTRYTLNESTKEIEEEQLGTFTQMPLKPAWAITVHKSQGLTFERAIIDVQYSFTHGQTYVALSRCRSLEGIVLSTPIPSHAIINDQQVVAFTRNIPEQTPTEEDLADLKRAFFLSLLAELFTFHRLTGAIDAYVRHIAEWFYKQYPNEAAEWQAVQVEFNEQVVKVSASFGVQYTKMVRSATDYTCNEKLQERCRKGAVWFAAQLRKIAVMMAKQKFNTRNKVIKEREISLRASLKEELNIKLRLLTKTEINGFAVNAYMHERAIATLDEDAKRGGKMGNAKERGKQSGIKKLKATENSRAM